MKSLLFFVLVLTISTTSKAQIDKERFEQIFLEEVADERYSERTNHSNLFRYKSAQAIPSWFTNPPVSNTNTIYAIGISDPAQDSALAMRTALKRAEIMANVLRRSTTQLLCDFFLNEAENTSSVVYEHYSRIVAKLPNYPVNYEVVNSYTNEFNETMVLIKYPVPENIAKEDALSIRFELYKNETETYAYGNFESVYEMLVKENGVRTPFFFQLTELGPRTDVYSTTDSTENNVPIYTLSYNGLPNADSIYTHTFPHGLWAEYFKSTMTYIMALAREKPENISVLADRYNSESYEKLTRGISVNKMRFVLTGIAVEQDELVVKMEELALD